MNTGDRVGFTDKDDGKFKCGTIGDTISNESVRAWVFRDDCEKGYMTLFERSDLKPMPQVALL